MHQLAKSNPVLRNLTKHCSPVVETDDFGFSGSEETNISLCIFMLFVSSVFPPQNLFLTILSEHLKKYNEFNAPVTLRQVFKGHKIDG